MPSLNIKRLHHVRVCIPAGFETEARAFYGDLLGLKEIKRPTEDGGIWYQAGESEIYLGVEPEMYPTKRFPAFEVTGIDEVRTYLQGKNITVKEESRLPGFKRISFLDPWKNKLELMERV